MGTSSEDELVDRVYEEIRDRGPWPAGAKTLVELAVTIARLIIAQQEREKVLRELFDAAYEDAMVDAGTTDDAFAPGHEPSSSIWWNPRPIFHAMLKHFATEHGITLEDK